MTITPKNVNLGRSPRLSESVSTNLAKLEDAAAFYGYGDTRRLYDRITRGDVLNIEHEPGRIIFHAKPNEVKGPLGDTTQVVLLPPGTMEIHAEVCPGSTVSGAIWQGEVRYDLDHPFATLRAETGYSGPIVEVTCWPRP